jgi:hypothetical protein
MKRLLKILAHFQLWAPFVVSPTSNSLMSHFHLRMDFSLQENQQHNHQPRRKKHLMKHSTTLFPRIREIIRPRLSINQGRLSSRKIGTP